MSYTISKIVSDVEICMDEIAPNDSEFDGQQDDTERATIIKSKLRDALLFIYAHADATLLSPTSTITTASTTESASGNNVSIARVSLPQGFVRLVYATCSGWSRKLGQGDIVSWDDPEYVMIKDKYLTSADRPAIAMTWSGTSKVLELFPSGTPTVGIVTDPGDMSAKQDNDSIDIPERCYRAFIYYVSGLVYVTYADQMRSSMMFEQANDIIGFTAAAAAMNNE